MSKLNVSDDFVKKVCESNSWGAMGVTVKQDEKPAEKVDESKKVETDKKEEIKEEVEKHTCPLCESELKEELSEERLLGHAAEMFEVFTAVNESQDEDSEDEVEEEEIEEEDEEEEVEEVKPKAKAKKSK